eukprot:6439592-Alexandrium_andersonii.AAC.1
MYRAACAFLLRPSTHDMSLSTLAAAGCVVYDALLGDFHHTLKDGRDLSGPVVLAARRLCSPSRGP